MKFLKKAYSDQEAKDIYEKCLAVLTELEVVKNTFVNNPLGMRIQLKQTLQKIINIAPQMLAIIMEKKQIPKDSKTRVAVGKIKTFLKKKTYNTGEFDIFQTILKDMTLWWKIWDDVDLTAEEGEDFFKVKDIRVRVTSKITPSILAQCKDIIETAVNLINKSTVPRFKEMLNNLQIFIVGGKKSDTIAYYNFQDDFVYLQHQYIDLRGVEESVHSLIHELGHRYLHKIASDSQKKEWKNLYREITYKVWSNSSDVFFPKVGDSISKDFKIETRSKYPQDIIKEEMFHPLIGTTVYVLLDGNYIQKNIFRKYLGFPTAYSAKSQDEFFCETLALIHMKKLKPLFADLKAKFLEIWQGSVDDDVVLIPPTKTPEPTPEPKTRKPRTPKVVVVPPTPVTYTEPPVVQPPVVQPPKTRKPRTPKPVIQPTPVVQPTPVAPVFTPSAPVVQAPSPTGSKFNPYSDIPTYLSRFEKTLAKIKMTRDSSTEWETKFMANMIKMLKQNTPYSPKQLLWIEKTLQKYST